MKKPLFCLQFSQKKTLYFTKTRLYEKPLFSKEPVSGPGFSDFALYLEGYLIYKHDTLEYESV